MRKRLVYLAMPALVYVASCHADVIVFTDLIDTISITINGVPLTGNGGRVTNFTRTGELVSFDLTAPGVAQIAVSGFTNLLERAGSDAPTGTVSDRFVEVFGPVPFTTYHVAIGSDPDLPPIPTGATDLTTIPEQGLPANPYFENGTVQKIGTSFQASGAVLDTFFVQSDVDVPEPASTIPVMLIGISLILGSFTRLNKVKKT
jgi:hypothetical protein